jgi:hypothetical protein
MRAIALLGLTGFAIAASAAPEPGLRVDGSEIVVVDDRGREIRGADIEGAELDLGALGTLRIELAEQDRHKDTRFPDETWLLTAKLRAVGSDQFVDACAAGANADRRMMLYSGYLDPQLHYVADTTRFSITCLGGVEAKCLRWGYHPWKSAPVGGASLAPYFEACIRLARADYCGDGQATTREGTSIDAYDRVGIMSRTPNLPDYAFEAGFGADGATCVHHARIPEHLALADLPARCPRLQDALLGDACDEDTANAQGALIVVRSVIRKSQDD